MTGPEPQRRLLVMAYTVFAIAAGSRAGVQLATRAELAPVAYTLSALSALVYLAGGLALRRRTDGGRRVAGWLAVTEFAGVLLVGTLSLLWPAGFPDASVWSDYGLGYGLVPAGLPVLVLWWLRRSAPKSAPDPAERPRRAAGTAAR